MPEVRRDRPVGREAMKITVIGALAVAAVILVIALLILQLNQGPNKITPSDGK